MTKAPVEVKRPGTPEKPRPDAWNAFRQEMERLFDRFTGGSALAPWHRRGLIEPALRYETSFDLTLPAVDVSEDATAYTLTAELPGMTEKDVEVKLSDDLVIIKGEKRQDKEHEERNYHVSERSYGAFERSFVLPDDADPDKIAANVSKGVLTVTLSKRPGAKPTEKSIPVKASS